MKRRWIDFALAALIFGGVLAIYLASGNAAPIDSKWSIYTAMSILREGNTDLDEYRPLIAEVNEPHPLETIDEHVYSVYPLGAPLIALPFVAVIDRLSDGALAASLEQRVPGELEMFIASVVMALTTVLLFGSARLHVSRRAAVCLVLVFALCTSAWSMASRALWQHAPSMLWLTLTLYLILLARRRPALIQVVGVPLALAYVARPTNSVSVVLFSLYVLLTYRRYVAGYVLGAALIAAPFVAFNLSVYHAVLSNYYRWFQDFSGSTLGEALIGHWFSPSRGLLIFSPVVVFSFYGMYVKVRQRTLDRLDKFLITIIALHWLSISIWPIWWGGWTFGPRMFADMLPYLIYFMIPVFATLTAWSPVRQRITAAVGFVLIGYSAFVHYRGANSWETLFEWNAQPVPIDLDSARVWEWRDVQFVRGIKYSLTGAPVDVVLAGVPLERLNLDTRLALRANDLRVRRFETPDALIATPGDNWFIIGDHQTLAPELAPMLQVVEPFAHASTLYDHEPYRVYHFDLAEQILALADQTTQVGQVGPGVRPPPEQRRTVSLPVQFGAAAELLGYRLWVGSVEAKVITYWRAGATHGGALRLFVHALGPDRSIVAQDDRLDAPSRDWQPGDLIVQINRLPVPDVTDVVWEVGLYNPESGERILVLSDGQPIDQRLLLQAEVSP